MNISKIKVGSTTYDLKDTEAPRANNAALTGTPTAPTAANGTNSTQIATTAFVMNAFTTNDAMLFKGTIGSSGATVTALPNTHKQGWTYKVATAGTYAGKVCEIGDMIICVTDGTSANNDHWAVVQTNIDGAVIGPSGSTDAHVAVFDGTTGKIIKDSGFAIESKAASASGTDLSLVTTGEKATWNGKQNTVAKLGSETQPLYTSAAGTFAKCSAYAGGTALTLNGTSKSATTAAIYAPTSAGTEGQFLAADANGIPTWVDNPNTDTTANWQGVDDEPTAGSNNLVKSGGVEVKLRGLTAHETEDNTSDNDGYIIMAAGSSAGRLYAVKNAAYRKINVEGVHSVRYLGIVQESGNSGQAGNAFYDETADPTTTSNTGFISGIPYEVGTDSSKHLKEYIVEVPKGAKYFYVMSKFVSSSIPTFNNDFYCYLQTGSTAASNEDTARLQEEIDILQEGSLKLEYDDVVTYTSGIDPSTDYPSGYQENMNTIRVFVNVKAGQYITANMPLGYGLAAAVYPTRRAAIIGGKTISLQHITDGGYVFNLPETEILAEGILAFTLRKSPVSVFTQAEYNQYLDALRFSLKDYGIENLYDKQANSKHLFIGTLAQKSVGSTELSDNTDTTRVSMLSEVCFPYYNIHLNIRIKKGYYFGIRYGNTRSSLSEAKEWYKDGDVVIIPDGYLYYRCYFSKGDDKTDGVTVAEIQELIDKGDIKVLYSNDYDIKENTDADKYVKSAVRYFFSTDEAGTSADALRLNAKIPNIPTFGHTSDIHGDVNRYSQFLDYCDYIGVDAALISGDFVAYSSLQSCQFINDIADSHKSMVLPCTGNHDCLNLTTAREQREQIVGYLMDKNNVITNPLEDYPTYFYKDFTEKNIRLISINLYEGERVNYRCDFTEKQCNWLIGVLAATPANYGVLLMFHSPEDKPNIVSGLENFYQNKYAYNLAYQSGITGKPFKQIIDAFISKTTATIAYTSNSVEVSVNADFTGVNAGVEFIAYITGHEHVDWVGYVNDAENMQLLLNVTSACICGPSEDPYGANLSDLPRSDKGTTQDSFNIYGIDRINKTVRIARVGSNVTFDGVERKLMIIPYANN